MKKYRLNSMGNATKHNYFHGVLSIVLALGLTSILASCSRERSDYERAKATGTVESYSSFLKQYPDGALAVQVKKERAQAAFERAKASRSTKQLQQLVADYPAPEFHIAVKQEIARIIAEGTKAGFQLLLERKWKQAIERVADLQETASSDRTPQIVRDVAAYFLDQPKTPDADNYQDDFSKLELNQLIGSKNESNAVCLFLFAIVAKSKGDNKGALELLRQCQKVDPSELHYAYCADALEQYDGNLKLFRWQNTQYRDGQQQTRLSPSGISETHWTKLPTGEGTLTSYLAEAPMSAHKREFVATAKDTELILARVTTAKSAGLLATATTGRASGDAPERLAFQIVSGKLLYSKNDLVAFLREGNAIISHPGSMVIRYDILGSLFILTVDSTKGEKFLYEYNF